MDLLATNQIAAGRAQTAATAGRASAINSDFETFLRLLTTQMKNQDPLNPMESTEFATQLAQFSMVEQQVRTNELLGGLQTGLATLSMGQIGGWIGMEARAEMPVNFQGQSVTLAGSKHPMADRMDMVVRNSFGHIVQNIPIPLSDDSFVWNGIGADGSRVPHGTYSFTIQNWAGQTMIDDRSAMVFGTVDEAAMVGEEIWLTMVGGVSIPAADVLGLGRPSR